jgi:hypothetical protein
LLLLDLQGECYSKAETASTKGGREEEGKEWKTGGER